MKQSKFGMPPSHQSSFKNTLRSQSPFKSLNNTKGNASKDLESYILRNSTESLKNAKITTEYNFKEVDEFE